ncbi:MAG: adenosylmethionine decarboxylase [Pseudomonadales bacterium]
MTFDVLAAVAAFDAAAAGSVVQLAGQPLSGAGAKPVALNPVETRWPTHDQQSGAADAPLHGETVDHFSIRDGVEFAGTHIILDLWGAERLDELEHMEATLRRAVDVAGATLLHIHLHHFTPNGGISGVAVLAESHISVHSWPERGFAAFDVFMCGDARPDLTVDVFRNAFAPERLEINEHLRGTTPVGN